MPDQFDKRTIFNKLKSKVQAKGFNLNVNRSDLPKGTATIEDLLEIIAESLSEALSQDQVKTGTIKAKDLKLGPTGLQLPMAYKNAKVKYDITTDPKFFAWLEAFHSLLQAVYPEAGYGAPNVFGTALKTLLALKPSSLTGRITEGSGKVKTTT